jgi:hypothetical protein
MTRPAQAVPVVAGASLWRRYRAGERDVENELVDLTTDNAGARNWCEGAAPFYRDQDDWGPSEAWSRLQGDAFIEQFNFLDNSHVPAYKTGPWRRVQCASQRYAFDRFLTRCRREQREEFWQAEVDARERGDLELAETFATEREEIRQAQLAARETERASRRGSTDSEPTRTTTK